MNSIPSLEELTANDLQTITIIKKKAYESAYDLLKQLNNSDLQIATAESLTAGMIMSTLVDIPWLGYVKYGCFGVYDTDAKRTFINVKVDNVYTHKCAAEMAIGVLKNSNASLAIAVTGNAMPLNEHAEMLGEVFIGIAGYNNNNEIIYITKSINSCIETDNTGFKNRCKKWFSTIIDGKNAEGKYTKYNERSDTATISQEIRYYTTSKALELCKDFVIKYKPICPDVIKRRKERNEEKNNNNNHTTIPKNKYEFGGVGLCKNISYCDMDGKKANNKNNNTFHLSKKKSYTKKKPRKYI
jgi:PncC family amidohydrolase